MLFKERTWAPQENNRPLSSQWQPLSHKVMSNTPHHKGIQTSIWLHRHIQIYLPCDHVHDGFTCVFMCVQDYYIHTCVFAVWPPCCDIRYGFRIKICLCRLNLQLFVGWLVLFTLFVLVCVEWLPTYIVLCLCFVCIRLVKYLITNLSLHIFILNY